MHALITAASAKELNAGWMASQDKAFFPDLKLTADRLVNGVGMKRVSQKIRQALRRKVYDLVLNIGTAGALKPAVAPLTILFPMQFTYLHETCLSSIAPRYPEELLKKIPRHWLRGALLSSSTPVISTAQRCSLVKLCQADGVDMEAFGIAEICQEIRLPFFCLKVISDQAGDDAEKQFRENLSSALSLLSEATPVFLRLVLTTS